MEQCHAFDTLGIVILRGGFFSVFFITFMDSFEANYAKENLYKVLEFQNTSRNPYFFLRRRQSAPLKKWTKSK